MILSPRQRNHYAVADASGVRVVDIRTNKTCYALPLAPIECLGISSSGAVLVVAERGDFNTITAYGHHTHALARIVVPWFPILVAVNNSVTAIAIVVRTHELPYDVVLIYDVCEDQMISVYHGYGAAVTLLRFVTDSSLMINQGVVVIDVKYKKCI